MPPLYAEGFDIAASGFGDPAVLPLGPLDTLVDETVSRMMGVTQQPPKTPAHPA